MRRRKLTNDEVRRMRGLYKNGRCGVCGRQFPNFTIGALARRFRISRSYCSEIIRYIYYTDIR